MTKPELRKKYKDLRSNLTEDSIENLSLKIANNALQLPVWDKNRYHIFMPIVEQKEVNTYYILQILMGKEKDIVVSKADFQTLLMHHFLVTEHTKFRHNTYNIAEPIEDFNSKIIDSDTIEVVFVPLLAFDKQGNRIGYGKGFYDRFLQNCKPKTTIIGLSFFEPETTPIPAEITDVTLQYCVTPSKIYQF